MTIKIGLGTSPLWAPGWLEMVKPLVMCVPSFSPQSSFLQQVHLDVKTTR